MRALKSVQNMHLISGAKSGNLKMVEGAIRNHADINTRKNGWTAWMHAYANYHSEVVKLLESKGAEVTDADRLTAGITAGMNKACYAIPGRVHSGLARS
jgi:ankyrin repeat protein